MRVQCRSRMYMYIFVLRYCSYNRRVREGTLCGFARFRIDRGYFPQRKTQPNNIYLERFIILKMTPT